MWVRKYKNAQRDNRRTYCLYNIWCGIKRRCYNQNYARYKDYGGRGITLCDEWMDFDAFVDWANDTGYQEGLTIERINNDGNYDPTNCTWATRKEQNRNRRTSMYINYMGETKTLVEWCEELGLKYKTIQFRLAHGWTVERAFNEPSKTEMESFADVCRKHGISRRVAYERIHKLGWDVESALNTPVRTNKGCVS